MSRYYQLVFLTIRDAERFSRYIDLVRPIVARYGSALERMLSPETHYGDLERPGVVNVVYYDDREAYRSFTKDPDFERIVHLRSESIDMASIEGPTSGGESSETALGDRSYLVELAAFGEKGSSAYAAYEAAAEPLFARYGHHLERRIEPETCSGFPFRPDVVKVSYFENAGGMDRMHADPAHAWLEHELYPAATSRSIWLVGKVHPSTTGRG